MADPRDKLADYLDRIEFGSFIESRQHPTKLMWSNFTSGVAHGFGAVVGATIFFGILVFLLTKFQALPLIGQFIKTLLQYTK